MDTRAGERNYIPKTVLPLFLKIQQKRQSHIVVVLRYMKYFDRDLPTTQPSQIQYAKQQASNHIIKMICVLDLNLFYSDKHSEKSVKSPTDVIKHVDNRLTGFSEPKKN